MSEKNFGGGGGGLPSVTINDDKGSRPVPDPTLLTTQQLMREIGSLKEMVGIRHEGYDRAIELIQRKADKEPSIDSVVGRLEKVAAVNDQRFSSFDMRLNERDIRYNGNHEAMNAAVKAEFIATKSLVEEQKKSSDIAISKSEFGINKQIEQISEAIHSMDRTLSEKIDDVKARIIIIESVKQGGKEQTQGISSTVAIIAAIVGVLVPISVLIVAMSKVKVP